MIPIFPQKGGPDWDSMFWASKVILLAVLGLCGVLALIQWAVS